MNIRNEAEWRAGFWDWSVLDGCFGRSKVRPADIDGIVERHGHVLFIETKGAGAPRSRGQQILLEHLATLPKCHVLTVVGDPGKPEHIYLQGNNGTLVNQPADLDLLRDLVSQWWQHANKRGE